MLGIIVLTILTASYFEYREIQRSEARYQINYIQEIATQYNVPVDNWHSWVTMIENEGPMKEWEFAYYISSLKLTVAEFPNKRK